MLLDAAGARVAPVDCDAVVRANARLSPDYHVLTLDAPDVAARTQPGQFVMVKPGRGLDPLLRRPFSVFQILRDAAGAPAGVSILGKIVGRGTALLYDLEPGERLACLGPLGRPFTPPPADRPVWFVAGGVGLAPFATLAESCLARGPRPTLFYGARRAGDLHYAEWFAERGVDVRAATEDGSAGAHGYVTTPLGQALTTASGADANAGPSIYVCGPTPMMRAVAALAQQLRRPCAVSLEQVMGCGLGGCYSCVVLAKDGQGAPHFVRSCIEGPVFDASRIVWNALAH
jgi:dihydroorotate dehydrogenase electron transfer subunit